MRTETVLGIHLNVRLDIAKKVRDIQKTFGLVYPGNYQYDPHVTLYLSKFRQIDFPILQKQIIRAQLKPIRLTITEMQQASHRNGAFISLGITERIMLNNFHMKIVRIANHLRGNRIRSKDMHRIREKTYSPIEIKALIKYGYLRVGSRFHPHVTLGSVAAQYRHISRIQTAARTLNGKSFMVKEVVIGLYAYDKSRHDYTKVIREHAIPLGA